MKLSPSVALYLAGMSALVSAESKPEKYASANHSPRSMFKHGNKLTEELCGRSVNKSLNQNFNFNDVLDKRVSGQWTDPTFNWENMIQWDDMNVAVWNDQSKRLTDGITSLRRISEMFDPDQYSMFGRNAIDPKDAMQKNLGDCWMVAAASSVATDPERIKKIFLTQTLNSAGVYALQFYLLGVPVTVSVDEQLPFEVDWTGENYSLVYGAPGVDGSLWFSILEKAAAKMYGNYEMLQGGLMGPAVQMLTGAPFYEIHHNPDDPDFPWNDKEKWLTPKELWDYIDKRIAANWVITCSSHIGLGSDMDFNQQGLAYSHAYSVLGTAELSNGQKLIKVRNPWGEEYKRGPWSDMSDFWTDQLLAEVNHVFKDDGVWYISADDYHTSMDKTHANPDVRKQYQSYQLFTNLEKGVLHEETITVTSPVAQKVYVSAYIYNDQHTYNGGCNEWTMRQNSSMNLIINDKKHSFHHRAYHAKGINMEAGEVLELKTEVKFGEEDLLPSDYSVVVWAKKMEVQMVSEGSDKSSSFPNFQLDKTIQQYNWKNEAIEWNQDMGQDESQDERQYEDLDESSESTEEEYIYDINLEEFVTDAEKLEHSFTFDNGVAMCTTELLSDDTFQQNCYITLIEKYDFNVKFTVQYDGETIETQAEVSGHEDVLKWSQKPGSEEGFSSEVTLDPYQGQEILLQAHSWSRTGFQTKFWLNPAGMFYTMNWYLESNEVVGYFAFNYSQQMSNATWKLKNTIWDSTDYTNDWYNLRKAGVDHTSLLSTVGEDGEDYDNGKSSAALAAGVLSLTLLGYCVFVRPGAQKTTDDFQRA